MSSQYRSSHSPLTPRRASPALSAVRSSPLAPLQTFPRTTSPLSSSPIPSSPEAIDFDSPPSTPPPAENRPRPSQPSPDYFQGFDYTPDMDVGVRIIENADTERLQNNLPPLSVRDGVVISNDTPLPIQDRPEKTWVVFHGKNPGVYPDLVLAVLETVGTKDGFQRAYPDRGSAEAAFELFKSEQVYPDYGKAPWVVFLGRKTGVVTKITELESSVKGFSGALFHTCSNISEGKIKFELFAQRVALMFEKTVDPFSAVNVLMPHHGGNQLIDSTANITMPTPQPIAGPSTSRSLPSVGTSDPRLPASRLSSRRAMKSPSSVPSQGWFVAFNAVLPGVYYGVEALKAAKPQPGGYRCATDEESAHDVFHEYMFNDKLTFVQPA